MVSFWRQAGLSYLQYSSIAARAVRRALKPDLKVDALKREDSIIRVVKWKDGKQQMSTQVYSKAIEEAK